MGTGVVVLLNGVSSSGKSSVAKEFVKLRPDFFHLSVDDFADWVNGMEDAQQGRVIPVETEHYFHRVIAMFSDSGVNVVVDHILDSVTTAKDCCKVLRDYPVLLVGVHCPVEELDRREAARRDRQPGQARGQLAFVHRREIYDVEVDTCREDATACAARISEAVVCDDLPRGWLQTCSKHTFDDER